MAEPLRFLVQSLRFREEGGGVGVLRLSIVGYGDMGEVHKGSRFDSSGPGGVEVGDSGCFVGAGYAGLG